MGPYQLMRLRSHMYKMERGMSTRTTVAGSRINISLLTPSAVSFEFRTAYPWATRMLPVILSEIPSWVISVYLGQCCYGTLKYATTIFFQILTNPSFTSLFQFRHHIIWVAKTASLNNLRINLPNVIYLFLYSSITKIFETQRCISV